MEPPVAEWRVERGCGEHRGGHAPQLDSRGADRGARPLSWPAQVQRVQRRRPLLCRSPQSLRGGDATTLGVAFGPRSSGESIAPVSRSYKARVLPYTEQA